jgi:membrane-associated protease RseP (regulator of RpoE activity)
MIGFKNALAGLGLLGSLIASPPASGQEPSKEEQTRSAEVISRRALGRSATVEERPHPGINEGDLQFFEPFQGHEAVQKVQSVPDPSAALPARPFTVWLNSRTGAPDPLEANYGLSLSEADDALRAQLEIPAGQGVVVIQVKPGSLAEQAGLKPNDVLLNLGDQKAGGVAEAKKILLGLGKDALEVKLIREGKGRRMSLVGPEHGFPREAAEYWIGVPVSPVDATLRAHLPSLSAEAGLIANDVVKGSPADKAGLQKNDLLVSLGGKPLKTPDNLIEQIQASAGKPTPLEILRAGKPTTLAVTPEKRAHPTTVVNRSRPRIAYQLVNPHGGVEVGANPAHGVIIEELNRVVQGVPKGADHKPIDIQLKLRANQGEGDDATDAHIQAQLKEMSAKLDEIRKLLDQLKKPDGK